jgi:hypothetical protein
MFKFQAHDPFSLSALYQVDASCARQNDTSPYQEPFACPKKVITPAPTISSIGTGRALWSGDQDHYLILS